MPRPVFDRDQYELRGHIPEVYTEKQKETLNRVLSRVNGQLDWNAQLLGFNGDGYWGKRIPTTDGSYQWKGLPETVSEKRAVQVGAFGVYAKDKPYGDRPAPFRRNEVGASADATFHVFESDGRTKVTPFGQPEGLLYSESPTLIAGGEYTFDRLVTAVTANSTDSSLFVTQDIAQGITSVRVLDSAPSGVFVSIDGSEAKPFLFFVREWEDISDWTSDQLLAQFIGVWGNKGNHISSHFLFDALNVHGFSEEQGLSLDDIFSRITLEELLDLVGLKPGPATPFVTDHLNFKVEDCDSIYQPAIPVETTLTEDEFGVCETLNYRVDLNQLYGQDPTEISIDPGSETSVPIGCNGIQYLFPPTCFIDNGEYPAALGQFYVDGGDYDFPIIYTRSIGDGFYDRDPFGVCDGTIEDFERIIDFDDLVADVAGEGGATLYTDPGADISVVLAAEDTDENGYDGFTLAFDGPKLSGITLKYESKSTYGDVRFPCIEWFFDPSLDNSTYSPVPAQAAWMGTDDGEFDRQLDTAYLAGQALESCVNGTVTGGFLSFDDGVFDEIVQPDCDYEPVIPLICEFIDSGLYQPGINPLTPPESNTECGAECGTIDGSIYIYGVDPGINNPVIDGGLLDVCTIYDNSEYDVQPPSPVSECVLYNDGVLPPPIYSIECITTDLESFSGSYTAPPVDDGLFNEIPGPGECEPCVAIEPTPIEADCTLDNGLIDGVGAPTSSVDDRYYDREIDDRCEPCVDPSAPVYPCPIDPLRVRLDKLLFSSPIWRTRPSVAHSLHPLRIWKNRVLNVADPSLDSAFANPLVSDENTGPDEISSYRQFVRLPVDYSRNGKFWNRAESVMANQTYFSRLLPTASTSLPIADVLPLLYDEAYDEFQQNADDFSSLYVEDFLVSTANKPNNLLQDGFEGAALSYEAPDSSSPLTLSTIIDFDAYAERKLNPNGTRRGSYFKFGDRGKPLTGFLETDIEEFLIRPTDSTELQINDAPALLIPNIEFPDDSDTASFSNYTVSYAYFVADLSAADEPVFDPDKLFCHREKVICKAEIDGGQTAISEFPLITRSRYLFHEDTIPDCADPIVLPPPQPGEATIASNKLSVAECDSTTLSLASIDNVPEPRSYQWQVNQGAAWEDVSGINYSGENTKDLTLTDAQLAFDGFQFRLLVTSSKAVPEETYSNVLTLSVVPALIGITQQPQDVFVAEGPSNVSFSVTASTNDGGTLSYQWQQNAGSGWVNMSDSASVSGSTSSELTLLNATDILSTNLFRAVISSTGCSSTVISESAELTFPNPAAQADYFVLTYTFSDGMDLDTRTSMLAPELTEAVGWGQYSTIGTPTFIVWGGDNQGIGVESVLINIPNFLANYPGEEEITLDLRAMWYGDIGFNPVVINATSYAGGAMIPSGFTWINPTATETFDDFSSVAKVITLFSQEELNPGQRVATMTINFVNGTITYGT